MENLIYETHNSFDPSLPFIFHKCLEVSHRCTLPNWHKNIELLNCCSGKGYVQCGQEYINFSAGDIVVVNADTLHRIYSDEQLGLQCLIIDNSFCIENGIPIDSLSFQQSFIDPKIEAMFMKLTESYSRYEAGLRFAIADIRHCVLGILLHLCDQHIMDKPQNNNCINSTYAKMALTYIRKNMNNAITLDSVADHIGISKYHLSREFKASTGKTVIEMVNLIRCTEAQRLIKNGMRVGAAASACGYENLSYFSRVFQRITGHLPSFFYNSSHSQD